MQTVGGFLGVLSAALCTCAFGQSPAASAASPDPTQQVNYKLIERELFVRSPPIVEFVPHTPRPEGLDVLEVYYATPGKHPLVLLTHASPDDARDRARITPWSLAKQAEWFARRGYVAFIVVRSGYGASSGALDIDEGPCLADHGGFQDIANAGVDDLRLVLNYAQKQTQVDSTTIVSAGVSSGGFAQLALVADPPNGLKAAINIAGGTGRDGFEHNCNLPVAIDAFRAFGKGASKHGALPMLWIFAQNDHWYPPYMVQRFEDAYTGAGGASQLVMAPPDGTDGQDLFSNVSAWSGTVDAFLKAHNLLPLGDMILPAPEAHDLPLPPGLNSSNGDAWRQFLLAPPFKTLVAGDDGATWMATGEYNQPSADHDGLELCRKAHKNNHCNIVARNSGVD